MIKIDVLVQDKNWKKYISNPSKYLKKKIKLIRGLVPINKKKEFSFSILLTGNKKVKFLNNKFRKKNKTTDVLSFPFYNKLEMRKKTRAQKKIYLGDIIINFYKINKKNFISEFDKLWIHGFLHLLGYKHYKNKDYNKMNKLENKIFKKINV